MHAVVDLCIAMKNSEEKHEYAVFMSGLVKLVRNCDWL